ncbi:MAG: FAD-binding oxidoreductase [Beijerinckiaceae bacterium]|nr:FAD-binding oxidoreductase [Beijerinckiaceae bacterium]
MKRTIAICGAGIIGAWTAYEAHRQGHDVVVIEPEMPGGEQAASFGNAAWIYEGSLLPMSTPGLWRDVPSYLLDPLGPFTVKWSYLPSVAPWLLKFVRAGNSVEKIEICAHARRAILTDTLGRYEAMACDLGLERFVIRNGLLFVFPSREEYEKEALGIRIRRAHGLRWDEWGNDELHTHEPELGPHYRFGVFHPYGGNLLDPGAFIAAVVAALKQRGVRHVMARATDFAIENGKLRGVVTDRGMVACDRAIIASGARSAALSLKAGDRIPLETERGYHLVVKNPACAPRHPLMPSDGKMGVTMTATGLRLAGQVELAGLDAPPDWRRADIMRTYLERLLPRAAANIGETTRWMGHRPSTPDGLPCIGPARDCADIFHGYGHGHSGIGMAPGTARLLVELAAGQKPGIDAKPFSAERFR